MTDDEREATLLAALNLAVVVRDEGADANGEAARGVLEAAGGDAVAALIIAATQIRPDLPLDRWFEDYADTPITVPPPPVSSKAPDEVVIERLVGGDRDLRASPVELHAAIERLDGPMNATQIADRIGCASRTVVRHRAKRREQAA